MIARQAFLKPFDCGIELAGEIKDCAEQGLDLAFIQLRHVQLERWLRRGQLFAFVIPFGIQPVGGDKQRMTHNFDADAI